MEKGIAGLEIKPEEKETDPAFRTRVKKKKKKRLEVGFF